MFNGLILNGGKSSRMGTEKGLISYHGMPQVEYLHQLLSRYTENVFISVKSINNHSKLNQIPDLLSIDSPLNGVYSAFKHRPKANWIVLSCDMPFVSEETITFLVNNWDRNAVFTGFLDSDEQYPDPMLGIWTAGILPHLENFVQKNVSPRKFIMQNRSSLHSSPNKQWLLNINTPEEFEQVKKMLS